MNERTNPFEIEDRDQDDFISTDEWEGFDDDDSYADEPYGEEYGIDDGDSYWDLDADE